MDTIKCVNLLGPRGTFTDIAFDRFNDIYKKIFDKYDIIYYKSIDEVVLNTNNDFSCGVIPIENSLDGYVQRTLDLLHENKMFILDEIIVPIRFDLVINGKDLSDIKKIYVQFKTNGQCRKLLNSLKDVEVITTESNMESYNMVMMNKPNEAAIIPSHITVNDNSKTVFKNVCDSMNNNTRFYLISKVPSFIDSKLSSCEKIKISICIIPSGDRPGLLLDILKTMSNDKLNMVSIMSRPTKTNLGTYNFYIEIEALKEDEPFIINTLNKMNNNDVTIEILGNYALRGDNENKII